MKAAIYVRVSSKDQNPSLQREELRQYCRRRELMVVEEYEDTMSGSKDNRPSLQRLLRDAKQRKFDAVVVWKLDRFGRSLRHLLTTLADLDALGVSFISLRDSLDLSTPTGRLQFQILGAVAEFERELIRERVRAGMVFAKKQGKHCGRPRRPVDSKKVRMMREAGATWEEVAAALQVPRTVCQRVVKNAVE